MLLAVFVSRGMQGSHTSTPDAANLHIPCGARLATKLKQARLLLQMNPKGWFRNEAFTERDRALIHAPAVDYIQDHRNNYLKKAVRYVSHAMRRLSAQKWLETESFRCQWQLGRGALRD